MSTNVLGGLDEIGREKKACGRNVKGGYNGKRLKKQSNASQGIAVLADKM